MEENFEQEILEDFDDESESKRQYNKIDINQFYLNNKGQLQFCDLCKECIYDCKASFRIKSIVCHKQNKANKNSTYKSQRIKNKLSEKELAKQIKKLIKEYESSGEYNWNFELYKEDKLDMRINEFYVQYYEKDEEENLPYVIHKAISKILYGRDV
jgi:HD superfamily phosphohydrolase